LLLVVAHEDYWGKSAGRRVRALLVVIDCPCRQRGMCFCRRREQLLVEAFIPQVTIEASDKGILGWLSDDDVVGTVLWVQRSACV